MSSIQTAGETMRIGLLALDAGHFLVEDAVAEYAMIVAHRVAGGRRNTEEKADR